MTEIMNSEPGRIFTIKFSDGQEWIVKDTEKTDGQWRPIYSKGWRRVDDRSYGFHTHKAAIAKLAALGQSVAF